LVFSIQAKNTAQKSASIALNDRFVLQPHTWYTCPAGKKANVKGSFECTGTGAAAIGELVVAGVIIHRWLATVATTTNTSIPRNTSRVFTNAGGVSNPPVGTVQEINVDLAAGESIVTDQDSGTNAEFNGFLQITESPV